MKNKITNRRGVTLIALVITIIVLLVLAEISISMISSQDGMLNKVTSAKETQKKTTEEEKEKLAVQVALVEGEGRIDISKLTEDSDIVKAYADNGYTYKGEGKFISKDGKEEISITETGEIEKIAVVSDVSKLTTEVAKMTKYVDNTSIVNKEAIIPREFKVSSKTNEQKIDTGLVVIDKNENEFVWVPVPNAIYDGTTEITIESYTPMARKINNTENYQGVLYDLNQTKENQKVYDFSTNGVGTTNYREPVLVEGNDMQEEYNNMVKSIAKYGGFYVGRYETGIEDGRAVSKDASKAENNTITADASQTDTNKWYGLYSKQRTMAKDNGLDSVESSMIWGSQYDAMMIWMQKTGNTINQFVNVDNLNKVYGLNDRNYFDFSLEASGMKKSWNLRSARGTSPETSSAACRGVLGPISSDSLSDYYASRLSLYIK
mgnify:CR=1 FL=1